MGGSFHPRLNIGGTPIANKYREGKMKRTSTGVLKVPEIAEREAIVSYPATTRIFLAKLAMSHLRKRCLWSEKS
jgi:hypothetical protein